MTIKSILVPMSEPRFAATSLKAAFVVAAPFAAHIDVLHARPDPRTAAMSSMPETMSAPMIERVMKDAETRSRQNARKTREAFDKARAAAKIRYAEKPVRGEIVTVAWREEIGYEDNLLQKHARLADLIVLPHPAGDADVALRLSLEAALMETGRPLLLVPAKVPSKIGGHIAIAWNGSAEAARAVDQAMPFIDRARKVTILTAAEPGRNYEPEGLQAMLAWHGVKATIEKVRTRGDIGKALLGAASRVGADMLVMGAYTHSRVRELVFGGVTRHVLSDAALPVLLAH